MSERGRAVRLTGSQRAEITRAGQAARRRLAAEASGKRSTPRLYSAEDLRNRALSERLIGERLAR